MNHFMDINIKTLITRNQLTEIFGGTPGARLALAQGEATLSAQETPHPCPACGRARSSQPPNTPGQGVGAAKECLQTPLCCSSPEFKTLKTLHPARQIKCASQKGHIWGITRLVPCPALNQRTSGVHLKGGRPEERGEHLEVRLSILGEVVQPPSKPYGKATIRKTGTRSLGPEMVLSEKRYCEAPFFYKYLSHSLSLSLTLTFLLRWLLMWMGPSQRAEDWPRNRVAYQPGTLIWL